MRHVVANVQLKMSYRFSTRSVARFRDVLIHLVNERPEQIIIEPKDVNLSATTCVARLRDAVLKIKGEQTMLAGQLKEVWPLYYATDDGMLVYIIKKGSKVPHAEHATPREHVVLPDTRIEEPHPRVQAALALLISERIVIYPVQLKLYDIQHLKLLEETMDITITKTGENEYLLS